MTTSLSSRIPETASSTTRSVVNRESSLFIIHVRENREKRMTAISLNRKIMLQTQPSQVPERIAKREKKQNSERRK